MSTYIREKVLCVPMDCEYEELHKKYCDECCQAIDWSEEKWSKYLNHLTIKYSKSKKNV